LEPLEPQNVLLWSTDPKPFSTWSLDKNTDHLAKWSEAMEQLRFDFSVSTPWKPADFNPGPQSPKTRWEPEAGFKIHQSEQTNFQLIQLKSVNQVF